MDAKAEASLRECVWLMGFKAKNAKIEIMLKKKGKVTTNLCAIFIHTTPLWVHMCGARTECNIMYCVHDMHTVRLCDTNLGTHARTYTH